MDSETIQMQMRESLKDDTLPGDLKEIVHRIAQDAEDIDLRLSEFKFIHGSKMLAVAVGGAVFVTGILFVLVSIFMFFNLFDLALNTEVRIAIGSIAVVVGAVNLMGGILLIGK